MPGGFSYIGDLRIEEDTGEIMSQSVGNSALLSTAADDISLEVKSADGKLAAKVHGAAAANGVQRDQMSKYAGFWVRTVIGTGAGAAGAFALTNTYGSDLAIVKAIVHVVSPVADLGIDIGTTAQTAASDNLMDGLPEDVAGVFDNIEEAGTNGKSRGLWISSQKLTGTHIGAAGGLVAYAGFYCIDITV